VVSVILLPFCAVGRVFGRNIPPKPVNRELMAPDERGDYESVFVLNFCKTVGAGLTLRRSDRVLDSDSNKRILPVYFYPPNQKQSIRRINIMIPLVPANPSITISLHVTSILSAFVSLQIILFSIRRYIPAIMILPITARSHLSDCDRLTHLPLMRSFYSAG
jgi:hypothetical protein